MEPGRSLGLGLKPHASLMPERGADGHSQNPGAEPSYSRLQPHAWPQFYLYWGQGAAGEGQERFP